MYCHLHFFSLLECLEVFHQFLLDLRMHSEECLLSCPQLLLLKLIFNVADGLVFLKLLLELFDFLVCTLRIFFMLLILVLQLCLHLLDSLRCLFLFLLHFTQHLLCTTLGFYLSHEIFKRSFYEVRLRLFEPLLHLRTLLLHLQEIPLHVWVLLQIPAESFVALFQPQCDILDLLLCLQALCLVAETLQLTPLCNQLFIHLFKGSLLLNDP
mmetsp:Transcript_140173/g.255053  ORF Transcript_140173/g.255053 Transcript_140173/m.255053 type:complete len:211 (+) Transcript_140173:533-1165(+)